MFILCRLGLFCLASLCVSIPAFGAADEPAAELPRTQIPSELRNQGYRLRLPEGDKALNEPFIIIEEQRRVGAELIAPDGRILDRGRINSGQPLRLNPRQWSLGFSGGTSTALANSSWSHSLLPQTLYETSLEATRQLGTWRLWGQAAWRAGSAHTFNSALTAKYGAQTGLVGLGYDIAPFGNDAQSWLRRWQLSLLGGVGLSRIRYRLSDSFSSFNVDYSSPAAALGFELRATIFNNFWFNLRSLERFDRLNIPDLNATGTSRFNTNTLGVSYAF